MRKVSRSYKIFTVCNTIFMVLLCITMLYPYINKLAIAFNTGTDSARGGVTIFPREFTLENFETVLNDPGVLRAAFVSVTRTILTVIINVTITFSASYALTRKNLKGHKVITMYFIIVMYITAGTIPTYILYRYLGLINNYWVYVLPFSMSVYNMLIIRSFISGIPVSLEESALIDGANEIQIMWKIIIPLSKPVLATVALWVAVGQWNDYLTSLYYVTNKNLYTLQYLLMRIIKQGETLRALIKEAAMEGIEVAQSTVTGVSTQAAMLIVTTVPIICVYPFLQKYFVKGVTLGAVKG